MSTSTSPAPNCWRWSAPPSGGQLQRGGPLTAEVTLTLDDGSAYPLTGKLQFTDVTVDPTTGTVRLRALFPNPDGILLPGLYVRATINEGVDPHGILVPQQRGRPRRQGRAHRAGAGRSRTWRACRLIKTGRAVGSDWQVLDGLKAGDRVIVEGLQNVQPDMPVTPMPAGRAWRQAAAKPARNRSADGACRASSSTGRSSPG